MNAVTKHEPQENQVADFGGSLLNVIASAARDPNVDIDKMERLIAMQERVQDRSAKAEYYAALAEMQPNLPIVAERGGITNKSGDIQSTYALWEDVNEAIRPILAEHGFALTFKTRRTESEIAVTGILSHRGGHCEETELSLPSDTSGSKNPVQAVGSSTSYGKRYTAFALLNITSKGEDDDGKRGGSPAAIEVDQIEELQRLIDNAGADQRKFCETFGISALGMLPQNRFAEAKQRIQAFAARSAQQ